jgi:hypothetical protein
MVVLTASPKNSLCQPDLLWVSGDFVERINVALSKCEWLVLTQSALLSYWLPTPLETWAPLVFDYRFFLVAGAFEALLFAVGGWGVLRKKSWARWLLLVLALMDIVGELLAQGTLMITIDVSILVAVILLVVSLLYRQTRSHYINSVAAK